jgi:hypothetical protein
MKLDTETLQRMHELFNLEGHMVSFKVETPTSTTGQKEQTPVLLIKEVWKTRDGKVCVKGIDFKKLTSPDAAEEAIRNYRIDRIKGSVYDLGLVAKSVFVNPPCNVDGYVSL